MWIYLELETFRGISIELYKAQNFYLSDFSNSEWFMKTTVLLYYATTLNALAVGPSQARLGFGSARLSFLEARLKLGSLAFASLGSNLARY